MLAPDLPHEFPPLKTLDAPPGTAQLAPQRAAAGDAENPYKGLRAFQEADAPDFFGREALTERLLARLGEAVPAGALPGRGRAVGQRQVERGARRAAARPAPGRPARRPSTG